MSVCAWAGEGPGRMMGGEGGGARWGSVRAHSAPPRPVAARAQAVPFSLPLSLQAYSLTGQPPFDIALRHPFTKHAPFFLPHRNKKQKLKMRSPSRGTRVVAALAGVLAFLFLPTPGRAQGE